MSDIKLFRLSPTGVSEVVGEEVTIEKSLQTLIERHAEVLLGITVLKTEYATGEAHGGRIDSLGIDENGSPVIIEYKRSLNENVINQGLYYLNWLMDHQGEFELLVLKAKGDQAAGTIDWINPRVVCIAGGFTKFDVHAVEQIGRNIALVRYKRFPPDHLMLEALNPINSKNGKAAAPPSVSGKASHDYTVESNLARSAPDMQDWFYEIDAFITSLGDDVSRKTLKGYFAYVRLHNFACVAVYPKVRKILIDLKLNPDDFAEQPYLRDVRNIGHYGTGDLEVTIASKADIGPALELIRQSYQKA